MELNNFYCLTVNEKRYSYTCDVFKKYNLPIPVKYLGFTGKNREQCCLFGHMSILMMARCLNLPYVFIFEDDAYPRRDIVEQLNYYLTDIPEECGSVILGRNGNGTVHKIDNRYFIDPNRPFGAHAYVVFQKCYTEMINSMEKTRIADIALKGNNFTEKNKPYWTNENLFIQKNIDLTCMSSGLLKNDKRYFYPRSDGYLGVFSKLPDNGMWD